MRRGERLIKGVRERGKMERDGEGRREGRGGKRDC